MEKQKECVSLPSKNRVTAIKTFFEAEPNGKPVTLAELKALSIDERKDMGEACLKVLFA